jgi:hypothetical protein
MRLAAVERDTSHLSGQGVEDDQRVRIREANESGQRWLLHPTNLDLVALHGHDHQRRARGQLLARGHDVHSLAVEQGHSARTQGAGGLATLAYELGAVRDAYVAICAAHAVVMREASRAQLEDQTADDDRGGRYADRRESSMLERGQDYGPDHQAHAGQAEDDPGQEHLGDQEGHAEDPQQNDPNPTQAVPSLVIVVPPVPQPNLDSEANPCVPIPTVPQLFRTTETGPAQIWVWLHKSSSYV